MTLLNLLLLLTFPVSCIGDEPEGPVSCVAGKACVLPCRFDPGAGLIRVEWLYKNREIYLYEERKVQKLNSAYRGHSSVFQRQISTGNASLQLHPVNPSDQGPYICQVTTKKDTRQTHVTLTVSAPHGPTELTTQALQTTQAPQTPRAPESLRVIVGIVVAALVVLVIVVAVVCVLRRKINTSTNHTQIQISRGEGMILMARTTEMEDLPEEQMEDVLRRPEKQDPSTDQTLKELQRLCDLEGSHVPGLVQHYRRQGRLSDRAMSQSQWTTLSRVLLSSGQRRFDLRKFCPSDDALQGLLSVIGGSTEAILSHCGVTSSSCNHLSSVLRSSGLKVLDLSNNDLKDSGLNTLCKGLSGASCGLETLRLSGCIISESSVVLASSLSSTLPHLKELDLRFNSLQTDTISILGESIKVFRFEPSAKNYLVPGLRKYALDWSLDPVSAQKCLVLSKRNRTVTHQVEGPGLPPHGGSSDCPHVLGSGFPRGRSYWEVSWRGMEVQVNVRTRGMRNDDDGRHGDGLSWGLNIVRGEYCPVQNGCREDETSGGGGVAYEGVAPERVGAASGGVSGASGGMSGASGGVSGASGVVGVTSWEVSVASGEVGVYLDTEAGDLCFFEMKSGKTLRLLHSFSCSNSDILFPEFRLGPGSSVSLIEPCGTQ